MLEVGHNNWVREEVGYKDAPVLDSTNVIATNSYVGVVPTTCLL